MTHPMSFRSLFLPALLVAAIWGFNFVVIAVGLHNIPPLFLAALRFTLAVFPAIFFVKRPQAPWKMIALYGLLLGVGEFGFLFVGMKLGAPAGLSSVILQLQAFFTALLAFFSFRERLSFASLAGMLLAFSGVALIGIQGQGFVSSTGFFALVCLLLAAFFWASANIAAKKMPQANALSLMVWSSVFSPIPLFLLSFFFEGGEQMASALVHLDALSLGAVAYLAFISTLVGYGIWNHLIVCHGAGTVAPFSLMVPFFGLLSAAIFLKELFSLLSLAGSVILFAGLIVHVFFGKRKG